jgi:hypothetical protein
LPWKYFSPPAHGLIAEPFIFCLLMRFASAAFPVAKRDRFWQAFCLAKQAPIRYTAGWISGCKLRGSALA